MRTSNRLGMIAALAGVLTLAACSSDDEPMSSPGGSGGDGGAVGGAGAAGSAGAAGGAGQGGSGGTGGAPGTTFSVTLANISGATALPTPFAPGVAIVHAGSDPIFTSGAADRGDGLEALAEDGDPGPLAANLQAGAGVSDLSVFNTPAGASSPAPILPGEFYEFSVTALQGDHLSLASMMVQSNDLFLATDSGGIPLFDNAGMPLRGDITASLGIWDAGTERNEAPGQGPSQAPRQTSADYGPSEGVVSLRVDETRGIPLPARLVEVTVAQSAGTYTVEIENISDAGPLLTPIAPVLYALHDDSARLFESAMNASAGLESLAEDGDPSVLAAEISGQVASVAVAGTGPFGPGESVQFDVTPSAAASRLSLAGMVGQSNDAFVATMPGGVALLDDQNMPRSADDVAMDIRHMLAVWDAGTERNEVPGVGPHQAPRQVSRNSGPADPDPHIRLYADSTNDLVDASMSFPIEITHVSGTTFEVTLSNQSSATAFPALLTPVLFATHDESVMLFETGLPASNGLESLAEDGNTAGLLAELGASAGVGMTGTEGSGPLAEGAFTFQVTVDASHRFLSLATMVVPSNDTFLALDPSGVALLDGMGVARSAMEIQADLADAWAAYEAGTEANQAGALGPDMAPYQAGPNTGAPEGDGTVRPVADVWSYPMTSELVRVVVTPQ